MIKDKIKRLFPFVSDFAKKGRAIKRELEYTFYSMLPESMYPKVLGIMYKQYQGTTLKWGGEMYTEKMQRAKLYDRDPRKTEYSDKYAVRKWVEDQIGSEYLIPLLGTWQEAEEIDFSSLPDSFVLKTNHASSDVVVVKNKKTLSNEKIKAIRRKMRHALNHSYELVQGFEMQYKGIPPLIIAERLIQDEKYNELRDYKFLCFDGVPYYCWVDCDRYTNHTRNVYDMEWNLMPWTQGGYKNSSVSVEKPENFDTMVEVAKKLSADFSHVRVDLYNVEGKIYFGEMTFTNGSGFEKLPDRINYELGCLWKLSC